MEKKLKSLKFNYVAVETIEDDQTTPGGIVLPQSHEADIKFGTVKAVGPGRWEYGKFVEPCVSVGDVVFFSRHSSGISLGDYVIFRDSEIYGTVE